MQLCHSRSQLKSARAPLLAMASRQSLISTKAQSEPSTNRALKKRRMQKLTMDRYEPLTMSGPRLHLEDQLRSRVYELLVFLYVLDRIGELRVSRYPSEDRVTDHLQLRELRRIFLD